MQISRLATYARRYKRSRKLGFGLPLFSLGTARDYSSRLPKSVRLHGRKIALSLPDEKGVRDAFLEVVLEDGYGLRRALPPVLSVLDIGANVGLFSLAVHDYFPEAVVHSYEPNAALEPFLAAQCALTGGRYFLEAVTRDSGWIALQETPGESVATKAIPSDPGGIPAIAFREAVERLGGAADFVKLDCEGAEWEILQDTAAWRNVRNLSLEYHPDGHPDRTAEKAWSLVEALGFTVDTQGESPFGTGWICARRLG